MVAFLPLDVVVVHQFLVFVVYLRQVADEYLEVLLLGQHGSSGTALASS